MLNSTLPSSSITLSRAEARRFMLTHHGLYPPRNLKGKQGILDYINHVGTIQFDPINIIGRNPDLVLQSRVQDFVPEYLDELLYSDRKLLDGWDKMASIYLITDWPYFSRLREHMNQPDVNPRRPPEDELEKILDIVRKKGPVSSLDFKESEIVDWFWGPTKIARAALESLFSMGKVGVHHRVNNRRSFDIIERLIPPEILQQSCPFETEGDYQDWHVLRRVGSVGLTSSKSGDYWLGILGVKGKERNNIFRRLVERGDLIAVNIISCPEETYFIRRKDQDQLNLISKIGTDDKKAAFIAALDNLIWNRVLIQKIFGFEYVWEVYKPKTQRKYGYYVLPVIYGDQFIARFEPVFKKQDKKLTITGWWWEEGTKPDKIMEEALTTCLFDFFTYLGAENIQVGDKIRDETSLTWIQNVMKFRN